MILGAGGGDTNSPELGKHGNSEGPAQALTGGRPAGKVAAAVVNRKGARFTALRAIDFRPSGGGAPAPAVLRPQIRLPGGCGLGSQRLGGFGGVHCGMHRPSRLQTGADPAGRPSPLPADSACTRARLAARTRIRSTNGCRPDGYRASLLAAAVRPHDPQATPLQPGRPETRGHGRRGILPSLLCRPPESAPRSACSVARSGKAESRQGGFHIWKVTAACGNWEDHTDSTPIFFLACPACVVLHLVGGRHLSHGPLMKESGLFPIFCWYAEGRSAGPCADVKVWRCFRGIKSLNGDC
ncbi:uncharacterized protein LOC125918423 [Panthera uncia]|uniref:uncharacterized protein LOC125918423 n=1 Tax=Panthera uncia TaxID=29064 RepID=UPI0020FF8BD1|nr:uncharacterized protein LOC125918423 [Panthera uncia]